MNDEQSSQFLRLFWMIVCKSIVKIVFTTFVCPSVYGWQVVKNNLVLTFPINLAKVAKKLNTIIWNYAHWNPMKPYCPMRTSWSHGHTTYTQRHQIPEKPSKSGLIRMWHKDNLYLDTNIIRNGNLHPTNINLWIRSIRMSVVLQ